MLEKFTKPEIGAARSEQLGLAETHLEKLAELLKTEAEKLRQRGFPVADDCRIDPNQFGDVIKAENIQADQRWAEQRRLEWEAAGVTETEKTRQKTGELLEIVKTLGINKLWFGDRFISIRTSRYDDYKNGVDNLIFDTVTNQPIAAIDETTDIYRKRAKERLMTLIIQGARVKYGVDYDHSRRLVTKKLPGQRKLPIFVINTDLEGVVALARDIESGETVQTEILERILSDLKKQSLEIIKSSVVRDPELKSAYERAGQIFSELRA